MLVWIVVFLLVEFIIITLLVENDHAGWALTAIFAGLCIYEFFIQRGSVMSALVYVRENPFVIVGYSFLWVLVGVAWSVLKWYEFLKHVKRERDKVGIKVHPSEYTPDRHKDKLVAWMIYWPFSMLWYMIHSPIRRLYNWVYEMVLGVYDNIHKKVFNV